MNLSPTHTVMKFTEMEDLFKKNKQKKKYIFPPILTKAEHTIYKKIDFFFSKSHSFHNCLLINNWDGKCKQKCGPLKKVVGLTPQKSSFLSFPHQRHYFLLDLLNSLKMKKMSTFVATVTADTKLLNWKHSDVDGKYKRFNITSKDVIQNQ